MQWKRKHGNWVFVLILFAAGLPAAELYCTLTNASQQWSAVLASLYYFPIVIAGINLGLRLALGIALAAGSIHTIAALIGHRDVWVEPMAEAITFICVAVIAARLVQLRLETSGAPAAKSVAHQGDSMPDMMNGSGPDSLSRALIGIIRHLRTPVTSIEGAGWVLDDAGLPEEKRRELVGIVRKEANRLNRILSDVLEFTQSRRPRLRQANLSVLIDDVVQLATPKDHPAAVFFRTNIPHDLPTVRADPEQMRKVFLNLISNSIQEAPRGSQIEISAAVKDQGVVVTVKDYGPGIPSKAVDEIFEPFFTTHERSLGLGLPMALRIVQEHGGTITLDRSQGEGASISVVLPLESAPPERR